MESTGKFPILKAGGMGIRSTSTRKDQTQENESQDNNHFDARQVEFKFPKEFDTKIVDEDNSDQEYSYKSSWIDPFSRYPVLNH